MSLGMTFKRIRPAIPQGGLSNLDAVALTERNEKALQRCAAGAHGSPMWQARKRAEGRDMLVLDQLVSRFRLLELDLTDSIRVAAEMIVPVPCMDDPDGEARLVVRERCLLGLIYPEGAIREPQPGATFCQILTPGGVWHASVARRPGQPLCLGATLPAGIQLKEIARLAYEALCLQSVMNDEMDAAGVMNRPAARWWQQHPERIPLSRASFLSDPNEVK